MGISRCVVLFMFAGLVALYGCNGSPVTPTRPVAAFLPVWAPAPHWIGKQHLGTPLDVHFQPIQGGGGSIFPGGAITDAQTDFFQHSVVELVDTISFDAHLTAWADSLPIGVRAGMGNETDTRFSTYRAYDVHFVSQVDDRVASANPPANAVWYPARIYWGHMYEHVCYVPVRAWT